MHAEWNNNGYFNEHPSINDQAYKLRVLPNMNGLMAPDENILLDVFIAEKSHVVARWLPHWLARRYNINQCFIAINKTDKQTGACAILSVCV